MHGRLDQIIGELQQARSLDQLNDTITGLREHLGTEHVIYHSVNNSGDQYAALTYDPKWVSRYISQDYYRIDPVVQGCIRAFSPFDWRRLDWSGRHVRSFLGEAHEAGVGDQGFSIPIRGPNGQFAIFTVNDASKDVAWDKFLDERSKELILVSHYINQQALQIESAELPPKPHIQALSPREVDALSYMALGFSRTQAADKLKISEHTLRVYIESARHKLGAMNTTHAVARALMLGLLAI